MHAIIWVYAATKGVVFELFRSENGTEFGIGHLEARFKRRSTHVSNLTIVETVPTLATADSYGVLEAPVNNNSEF